MKDTIHNGRDLGDEHNSNSVSGYYQNLKARSEARITAHENSNEKKGFLENRDLGDEHMATHRQKPIRQTTFLVSIGGRELSIFNRPTSDRKNAVSKIPEKTNEESHPQLKSKL